MFKGEYGKYSSIAAAVSAHSAALSVVYERFREYGGRQKVVQIKIIARIML